MATRAPSSSVSPARDDTNSRPTAPHGRSRSPASVANPDSKSRQTHVDKGPSQRKRAGPSVSLSPRPAQKGGPSAADIAKRKLKGKERRPHRDQEQAQRRQRRRSDTINGASDRSPGSENCGPPAATAAQPDQSHARNHVSFAKAPGSKSPLYPQGAQQRSKQRREQPSVPVSVPSAKAGHIICVTRATSSEASSSQSSDSSNHSTASTQVNGGREARSFDEPTADMSHHLKALIEELSEAATKVANRPALSSSDKDLIALVQKQAGRIHILISASTSSKRLQQEMRATSKAILAAAPVPDIDDIKTKFNAVCDLIGMPASSRIKSNPPSPQKRKPAHNEAPGSTSTPASPNDADAERQAKATALMRRLIRKKTENRHASKGSPATPAKPSGLRQSVSMETIKHKGADAEPTEKPRPQQTHAPKATEDDRHERGQGYKHVYQHREGGGDRERGQTREADRQHTARKGHASRHHDAHESSGNGDAGSPRKAYGRKVNGTRKGAEAKHSDGHASGKKKRVSPEPTRLTAEALAVQQELAGDDCPIGRMRVNMVDDEAQLEFPRGSHGEIRFAERRSRSSFHEEARKEEERDAPRGETAARGHHSPGDKGNTTGPDLSLSPQAKVQAAGEESLSMSASAEVPPGSVVEGCEYLVDGMLACKLMYIGPLTEQRARRNLKRLDRAERREREEPLSEDEEGVDEVAVYPDTNNEALGSAAGTQQRVWCGVMYLKKRHGINDGKINGMRFFECDTGYGEFLHPSRLKKEPAGTDAKFMQATQELLDVASSTDTSADDAASSSSSSRGSSSGSDSMHSGARAADYDVVSLDVAEDDEDRADDGGANAHGPVVDPSSRVTQGIRRMSMDAYGNMVRHPSVVLTDEDGSVLIDFITGTDNGNSEQRGHKGKKRVVMRAKRKSIEPQDLEQQALHLAAASTAVASAGAHAHSHGGEEYAKAGHSAHHTENNTPAAAAAGDNEIGDQSDDDSSVGEVQGRAPAFVESTEGLPRVLAARMIAGPEPDKPKRTEVELMQELDTVQVTLEALRRESDRKDKVIDRLEEQLQQARRFNDNASEDGDSVILPESAGNTDRLRADLDRQVRLAAMNKEYISEMEEQLEAKNSELQALKSELESLRKDGSTQAMRELKDELASSRERVRQLQTELEMTKAETDAAAAASGRPARHATASAEDNANHRSFVGAPPSPIAPVQSAASPEPSFREADTPVSPVVAEIDRMVRNSLERSCRVEESFRTRVLRSNTQAGSILSPLAAGDKENATPETSTPSRRLPGSPRFRGTPPAVRWSSHTMEEKDKEIEGLKDKLAEMERENEELRGKNTQASLLLDAERKQANAREAHIASFAASSFHGNETFATARDASLLTSLMDMSDEELNRLQENKVSSLRKVVQSASRVLQSMDDVGADADYDAARKSFDLGPPADHRRGGNDQASECSHSSESDRPLSIARCSSSSFEDEGPPMVEDEESMSTRSDARTDGDADEESEDGAVVAAAAAVAAAGSRKKHAEGREQGTKEDDARGARESGRQQRQQQVHREQHQEQQRQPTQGEPRRQNVGAEKAVASKGREHSRTITPADAKEPGVQLAAAASGSTAPDKEQKEQEEQEEQGQVARKVTLNLGSVGGSPRNNRAVKAPVAGPEMDEDERRDRVSSPLRKSHTSPRGRRQSGRLPSLKRQESSDTRRSSETSAAAAARRRVLRRIPSARRSSMQSSNSLHSSMVDAPQSDNSDTSSVSSQDDVNAYVEDKARSQVVSNRGSFMEDNDPHEYFESGGSDDDEMAETLKKLEAVNENQHRTAGFLLGVRSPSLTNGSPGSHRSSNMYHYEVDDDGLTESASMLTVPLSRATSAYDLEQQSQPLVPPSELDAATADPLLPEHGRGRAPSVESVLVLQDLSHLHRLICNCDIENVDRCPKIKSLRADPTAQASLHPQVCRCKQNPAKCQLLHSILFGTRLPPSISNTYGNHGAAAAAAPSAVQSTLAPKIVLTSAHSSQENIYRFEDEEEGEDVGQQQQQQQQQQQKQKQQRQRPQQQQQQRWQQPGGARAPNGEPNTYWGQHSSPRSSSSGPDSSKAAPAGVQLLRRQVPADENDDDSLTSVHTSASQQRLSIDLGLVSAQEAAETTGARASTGTISSTTTLQKRMTEGQGGGWWSRKLKSKATAKTEKGPQQEGEDGGSTAESPETNALRGASLFRSKIRAVAFAASKKPPAKGQLAKFKKYASIHDFASTEDGESRAGIDAAILQDLNQMEAERGPEAADSVFGLSRRGSRRASANSAGSGTADISRATKSPGLQHKDTDSAASSETGSSDSSAATAAEVKEDTQAKTTSVFSALRLRFILVALVVLAAVLAVVGAVIAFPEETWAAVETARVETARGTGVLQNATRGLLPRVDHVPVWIPRAK